MCPNKKICICKAFVGQEELNNSLDLVSYPLSSFHSVCFWFFFQIKWCQERVPTEFINKIYKHLTVLEFQ